MQCLARKVIAEHCGIFITSFLFRINVVEEYILFFGILYNVENESQPRLHCVGES